MPADAPVIPLARWADRQLRELADLSGAKAIADLAGATVLGERAAQGGFLIPGNVSAGRGGSRLLRARAGWFALTLTRPADRELLPALFAVGGFDGQDDAAIAAAVAQGDCATLLERGRQLGLAVATVDEVLASDAVSVLTRGASRGLSHQPLVVDLSAIWAGPLAGHLFWLAGARVVKVESRTRRDAMREGDPTLFALLDQGKDSVAMDFAEPAQKAALLALLARADIVIEASRPRALMQLGIDADAIVRASPGLVWLTITGHGATGRAANWIGVGHDCGVAGGLSRALADVTGQTGFVGDAIADPLTGITAALAGWRAYASGGGCRIGVAMSAVAAQALHEERTFDRALLEGELRGWGASIGQPFPGCVQRNITAPPRPFGSDTAAWLGQPPC